MSHTAGEGANGFHFLGTLQLGLQILSLEIRQLALGDINADAKNFFKLFCLVKNRFVCPGDPCLLSIFAMRIVFADPQASGVFLQGGDQFFKAFTVCLVFRQNKLFGIFAQHFLFAISKKPLGELIRIGDMAFGVHSQDNTVGGLDKLAIFFFTLTEPYKRSCIHDADCQLRRDTH